MIIRKSCLQDLPYIYEICLKTGASGKDATELFNDKNMLGSYYAAPYIVNSPKDCFVVVENGLVCGYILSLWEFYRGSRYGISADGGLLLV